MHDGSGPICYIIMCKYRYHHISQMQCKHISHFFGLTPNTQQVVTELMTTQFTYVCIYIRHKAPMWCRSHLNKQGHQASKLPSCWWPIQCHPDQFAGSHIHSNCVSSVMPSSWKAIINHTPNAIFNLPPMSSKWGAWHAPVACGTITIPVRHLGLLHFRTPQKHAQLPPMSCVRFWHQKHILGNVNGMSNRIWLMQDPLHNRIQE